MKTQLNNLNTLRNLFASLVAIITLALPVSLTLADELIIPTAASSAVRTVNHVDHDSLSAAARTVTNVFVSDSSGPLPREDLNDQALVRLAVGAGTLTPEEDQLKITARYQDPKMLRYLQSASAQQINQLFSEASNLIDTRHVNPLSYEERTQGAILGLIRAVENPAFLQVNRINANSQSIRDLQSELSQLARSQPARSMSESLGVMQWAQELANRRLGLRREAVALEFFNSTIDSLDKYSAFMPGDSPFATGAVEPQFQTAALEENIVGIGVELKAHEQGALVVDVVENGPAAQMQLQSGDIIIAVNTKSIAGQGLGQIADQIGGQAGSTVTLDVERNGRKYRGTTRRAKVYVSSVSGSKMIDTSAKVGYLRLKQFSESSAEDLEKAMWNLHNQGMKTLVLDLRGNPGGLLDESIQVADLFLTNGTIVATKGRTNSDNTSEMAKFEKTWSIPLVVLVDENSASASEILAAAIQEHRRGVVVGRNSYGKGTVQTHFPLKATNGLLKLTTAKFYSPAGREMAGVGVAPDVSVNATTVGYRGTSDDADVRTALQVVAQGLPAQLAAQANTNQAPQAGSMFNNGSLGNLFNNNLTNANPYQNFNTYNPVGGETIRNYSQQLFGVPQMDASWKAQ